MSFLLAVFAKIKLYLAGAGALIVAIAFAFLKGRADGNRAAKVEQANQREKAASESKEIENETDRMSDADLDRANDKWVRK
jgi:hypothetical protein